MEIHFLWMFVAKQEKKKNKLNIQPKYLQRPSWFLFFLTKSRPHSLHAEASLPGVAHVCTHPSPESRASLTLCSTSTDPVCLPCRRVAMRQDGSGPPELPGVSPQPPSPPSAVHSSCRGGCPVWKLPCQLCMYFGEMKVSLPESKKEMNLAGCVPFFTPSYMGVLPPWGTVWPLPCCCETISPVSGSCFLQVRSASENHREEHRSECLIFLFVSQH